MESIECGKIISHSSYSGLAMLATLLPSFGSNLVISTYVCDDDAAPSSTLFGLCKVLDELPARSNENNRGTNRKQETHMGIGPNSHKRRGKAK